MEKLDSWLEADWQWKQIQERWLCVKVLLSGMKSSFCDSKKAAVERVHVQSSPQTKQDRHTHPLDPGSNPGNSYALGHDNQLDSNTLAAFWTCRSCKDGTEDVKQGTQGSWVAQDTHGARKESVEADPEADWPSCPQRGQTQALWGLWNVTGISGGNSQHPVPKKKKKNWLLPLLKARPQRRRHSTLPANFPSLCLVSKCAPPVSSELGLGRKCGAEPALLADVDITNHG